MTGTRSWLALPAPDARPLTLLRWSRASGKGRLLYGSRDGWEIAAVGEAEVLDASGPHRFADLSAEARVVFGRLEPVGDEGPMPMLIGGFSFVDDAPAADSDWQTFGSGRFVLPIVSLLRRGDEAWLIGVGPEGLTGAPAAEHIRQLLFECGEELMQLERTADAVPGGPARADVEPPVDYRHEVADALDAISDGSLSKVAVARSEAWRTPTAPSVSTLLDSAGRRFPDCFRFCVEPADGPAFVGASPERLVAVADGAVRVDALAGTAHRGGDDAEDAALGDGLLADDKERREHGSVVDYVRDALRPVCATLNVSDVPGLLRLANVQHLHTPISGQLANGEGVLDLAERLHPTPAVGGMPRDDAMEWLASHEVLERGWYSGGVGVVGSDGQGELCVAIRSGLVNGTTTRLYAGAGIVRGSVPDREAAEVDHKLRGLREVLVDAS